MLVGTYDKNESKGRQNWKKQAYLVPVPSRRGIRLKATAIRGMHRWTTGSPVVRPVTVVVPALYNFLPAEGVAMGWLNEIDSLHTIRQRIICAAKITGWDVFTFHTLHNLDSFFDTTINAVRDTWLNEGSLTATAVKETKARFGNPYDYYRLQPRLIDNLVFQSSLMDWLNRRAESLPLRFHVIGTGLLSALVSTGALPFGSAVETALSIGSEWDASLQWMAETKASQRSSNPTESEIGWIRFEEIRKLVEGQSKLSVDVLPDYLPSQDAIDPPSRPFWYSPDANSQPVLIQTAKDAARALETLNIASWSYAAPQEAAEEPVRGWLVSPLHPAARACKWSVSNYLLATPSAVQLFLDHIAALARVPLLATGTEGFQGRFRLSRMKVTGP